MAVSHHQNAGQNHSFLNANKSLENVAKFKCLEKTVTNQNCILEEIGSRLNLGTACYHSVKRVSSHFLKDLKIKICETIILPVILYGCDTWFFTLKEKHRLRVFENRVLRRLFGPKGEEVVGGWRRLHNKELCNLH
jgi:hypothetical protein